MSLVSDADSMTFPQFTNAYSTPFSELRFFLLKLLADEDVSTAQLVVDNGTTIQAFRSYFGFEPSVQDWMFIYLLSNRLVVLAAGGVGGGGGPALASQAEAEAGTNNTKFMSPLRVQQWYEAENVEASLVVNDSSVAGDHVDAALDHLVGRISPLESDVASLDTRLDNAEADIDALQISTSSLNSLKMDKSAFSYASGYISITISGTTYQVQALVT